MNSEEFVSSIEERLLNIYKLQLSGQKDEKLKYQTEGYMHAGKVLGLVSNEQLMSLIEQAHFSVFGVSIKEREKQKQKALMLNPDYELINIPAFLRKKQKNNTSEEDGV